MRFRLALVCMAAALAAPAAHATSPIPPLLDLIPSGVQVQDYCVYEVDRNGHRRPVACVPAGSLPRLLWVLD